MTEAKGKHPGNPMGPIGKNVIAGVEELRKVRGLSYDALSANLSEKGRYIFPFGLSRLGRGERRVDVDDLVALAVVLGVNPNALLLPRDVGVDDLIELTPKLRQRAGEVWAWADGASDEFAPGMGQDPDDFRRYARPRFGAQEAHPAIRELQHLAGEVQRLIDDPENHATWNLRVNAIRSSLERVRSYVDELTTATMVKMGGGEYTKVGPDGTVTRAVTQDGDEDAR
jgi:hypothetical protein